MADWILMLPPSEGKAEPPKDGPCWPEIKDDPAFNHFAVLNTAREALITEVQEACSSGKGLEKLFGVKGKALEKAVHDNQTLLTSPIRPTTDVYTGVMYDAIGIETLSKAALGKLHRQTFIVSGLFGLLRASDLIPVYKLKISAAPSKSFGRVAKYWRDSVSELLNQKAAGKLVWDLLPDEHRFVWVSDGKETERVQLKFQQRTKKGEVKVVNHHSKSLKGAFVRQLCEGEIKTVKDAFAFTVNDYAFDENSSLMDQEIKVLVYTKED